MLPGLVGRTFTTSLPPSRMGGSMRRRLRRIGSGSAPKPSRPTTRSQQPEREPPRRSCWPENTPMAAFEQPSWLVRPS